LAAILTIFALIIGTIMRGPTVHFGSTEHLEGFSLCRGIPLRIELPEVVDWKLPVCYSALNGGSGRI